MADQLRDVFAEVRRTKQRAALVAYTTCGYPTVADTVPVMLGLERGGADVIEVGVPFSDPIADGPTIQTSTHRALQNGVSYKSCLAAVREARAQGLRAPVVLMGYYNPLLAYGEEAAVREAREAGANGFIVVDLPPEESKTFHSFCVQYNMAIVPLIAPTTSDARLSMLCKNASSFVYCVSVTGVTGKRASLPVDLSDYVKRVRAATDLPIAVGFGISTREHFRCVDEIADGVVIGSAIIRAITEPDEGMSCGEAAKRFALSVTED